ncbi:hypothetical protein [Nioella aestuarii]|uniref:hypothetical protein n=1 Tax=Nioella aestuarii TaxID=1662864 RepID=UPI003D7F53C4
MTHELDDLFAQARGAEVPGDDLVARVLADAETVQAELATPAAPAGGGWIAGLLSSIGGWVGAGGLVAATSAGLLIGVYAPDTVDNILGGQLSELGLVSQDDLLPGLTYLLPGEGE